jgi:hypothetical protein
MNIWRLNLTKVCNVFARKNVASFISDADLVHNKQMNVHIIESIAMLKQRKWWKNV